MSDEVEKPRSKSKLLCPKFNKPQNQMCHRCVFWEHIKGRHPQTGEPLERWGCVIVHSFMLQLENNKVTYEQGAATESLRNEMVTYQRLALRVQFRSDPDAIKVIEGEFKRMDDHAAAKQIAKQAVPQLPPPTVVEALQTDERVSFPAPRKVRQPRR
jgi:hypothetical protein